MGTSATGMSVPDPACDRAPPRGAPDGLTGCLPSTSSGVDAALLTRWLLSTAPVQWARWTVPALTRVPRCGEQLVGRLVRFPAWRVTPSTVPERYHTAVTTPLLSPVRQHQAGDQDVRCFGSHGCDNVHWSGGTGGVAGPLDQTDPSAPGGPRRAASCSGRVPPAEAAQARSQAAQGGGDLQDEHRRVSRPSRSLQRSRAPRGGGNLDARARGRIAPLTAFGRAHKVCALSPLLDGGKPPAETSAAPPPAAGSCSPRSNPATDASGLLGATTLAGSRVAAGDRLRRERSERP